MESLNCSLANLDLENLAREILNSEKVLDAFLQVSAEDANWVEDNICGRISDSTFMKIIVRSYRHKKYRLFLREIIDVIDGADINDRIFEKIINYPYNRIKAGLLISLAHKKLNEYQMILLCNEGIAFECYFELAILYYTEDRYELQKLKEFIEYFNICKYSYMTNELINELLYCYTTNNMEKYTYISGLV